MPESSVMLIFRGALNQYEDIGYFHLIVLSEILDVRCLVRVQALPGAGLKGRGGL